MPSNSSSSNPAPRRSSKSGGSSGASARPTSRGDAPSHPARTMDLSATHKKSTKSAPKASLQTPKPPLDAGAKRRALKKKRGRQNNLVAWLVAAAITVTIAGTAAGIWTELQSAKGRVAQKRATFADLQAQFESGKRRLSALASASGKERVLVENGFIKPGERLLLFPKTQSHKK
ncbi:hypothetical protein [Abditibacterium utsteinense]|nr:hypothetical protein [Abditibacterium utsteinense]